MYDLTGFELPLFNLHIVWDQIVKIALITFLNDMPKNQTQTGTIKFNWTSIHPYFIDLYKANL
jgi:hypothetical protein